MGESSHPWTDLKQSTFAAWRTGQRTDPWHTASEGTFTPGMAALDRQGRLADNDPCMADPRLIIFDDGAGNFGPMTDLRAAFSIRTGVTCNRVRIEGNVGLMATDLWLNENVAAIRRETETDAHCNQPLRRGAPIRFHARQGVGPWTPITAAGDASALLVNGRWSGEPTALAARVRQLPLGMALVQRDGAVIAAHLPCDAAQRFVAGGFALAAEASRSTVDEQVLLARPWDVLVGLEATLRADLGRQTLPLWDREAQPTVACLGEGAIRVAVTARIHPMVVLNSEKGPIVIEAGAIVGSFAVIAGPCYLGANSIVQPHAHIRPNTAIGPHCLVAGEISQCIIEGYSNKAHAGYLGNSYVGQWVNLGADTVVSNLKNTYGSVRMQLDADAPAQDTGQSKLGPVIGDFVRTAIATRINTGACLGTASMIALSGLTPKFINRFTFATDAGLQRYDVDRFLATAAAVMARRDRSLTPALEARLRQLAAS